MIPKEGHPNHCSLCRERFDKMLISPIKPIHNEKDHAAMLKQIEILFHAKPDTPEANRLEVLSVLLWVWEEKMEPPLPKPEWYDGLKLHSLDEKGEWHMASECELPPCPDCRR